MTDGNVVDVSGMSFVSAAAAVAAISALLSWSWADNPTRLVSAFGGTVIAIVMLVTWVLGLRDLGRPAESRRQPWAPPAGVGMMHLGVAVALLAWTLHERLPTATVVGVGTLSVVLLVLGGGIMVAGWRHAVGRHHEIGRHGS